MANAIVVTKMKVCNLCSEEKALPLFSAHKTTKDGKRTYCKDCGVKMVQNFKKVNPLWELGYRLKRKYGISIDEYNIFLERQDNKCSMCECEFSDSLKRRLCVDHCHKTGKIRGLLCFNCNTVLGKVNDDVHILLNAVNYLKGNFNYE